ncbi:hypothetical protein T440DRAFT_46156 [Plenodomus tracheiphilus IPT5]|uniref:Uncharacterized protein n=1 Tax=Plenodomus tracheiphilus IPT5 TaxID=1408161 RepID=A0A6A7BBY5_9PLEO|nr:hypothetical protein T440DRAFT_46156 [Plenodomus tracheiphilus IPT5]
MDQAKSDVDAILEQIIRLGVLIRSSGAPSRVTKADAYFDTQNYQQLENEKYPHSAKLPLQDLLALKSHLLSYIFLNPQRFARNQLTQYDLDFRKDLAELSPQRRQILESLLFANLRRRNRFWYARTHAEKLAATQELYFPQQSTTDISKKDVATDSATTLHMKEQPKVGAILNDTETAASEFKLDQNLLKPIDTPKPPMSRVSVSIQGSGWPRPPLLGPGRRTFRCPCCHLTLSEDDAELISWRCVDFSIHL